MSKIISIGTAVPPYRHEQEHILQFMLDACQPSPGDTRKIKRLYEHSGIRTRYSVIPDYSLPPGERVFYPATPDLEPFPCLEQRMEWYLQHATGLSVLAMEDCLNGHFQKTEITHLITVSCTGLSAPGLDIHILRQMSLPSHIYRTSVNFMGCYAALHALKMADAICRSDPQSRVMIVCTELCTLHFQKEPDMNHIASGLLFGDGSAAMMVTGDAYPGKGLHIAGFCSEVALDGLEDMAWELSGKGFLMTLSAFIPRLVQSGIGPLIQKALHSLELDSADMTRWAIHPGGKKILQCVAAELSLPEGSLSESYEVLSECGNMSSPTVLFVLKKIMQSLDPGIPENIFTAAFGPGLTLETVILRA